MKRVLVFIFLVSTSYAHACKSPSKDFARDFFDNESHWIEVQKGNLEEIEPNKTIEVMIDFNQFSRSKAYTGGELLGHLEEVCHTSNPNELLVKAKNYSFKVRQKSFGLEIKVLFFTYYLRPLSVL